MNINTPCTGTPRMLCHNPYISGINIECINGRLFPVSYANVNRPFKPMNCHSTMNSRMIRNI